LRYATPIYSVYSKILIKDGKSEGTDIASSFQELGAFKSRQNINNEIAILKSKPLMWRVMQELNLNASYYRKGTIKTLEVYGKELPFKVLVEQLDSKANGQQIEITAKNKQSFTLKDSDGEKDYLFGSIIKKPYASFTVIANTHSIRPGN